MSNFYRIGDVFRVKYLEEIRSTPGVMNVELVEHNVDIFYTYCTFKNTTYVIFEDLTELRLQGEVGTVRGGIYEKYLNVEINGRTYMLPHFALEPLTKEIVELEEVLISLMVMLS